MRLLARDAGLQAGDGVEKRVAVNVLSGRKLNWDPEVNETRGELECRRYHADDKVDSVVQRHRAPDDGGIGAEPASPEALAEHDGRRRRLPIVVDRNGTSTPRRDAKRGKEVAGHRRTLEANGLTAAHEISGRELECGDPLERRRVVAPVAEVRG